eukprot:10337957-Lingulodinium_polyedra.AAC.1
MSPTSRSPTASCRFAAASRPVCHACGGIAAQRGRACVAPARCGRRSRRRSRRRPAAVPESAPVA